VAKIAPKGAVLTDAQTKRFAAEYAALKKAFPKQRPSWYQIQALANVLLQDFDKALATDGLAKAIGTLYQSYTPGIRSTTIQRDVGERVQEWLRSAAPDSRQMGLEVIAMLRRADQTILALGPADQVLLDTIQAGLFQNTAPAAGIPNIPSIPSLSEKSAERISTQILLGVRGGRSFETIKAGVESVIAGTRHNAYTLANTHLQTAARVTMAVESVQSGAELFEYVGPVDEVTRDFCAELVGQRLPLAEIHLLDNDQGLPVFTCGGGYNCRHEWYPVFEGEE
jgi:hypothetical protein